MDQWSICAYNYAAPSSILMHNIYAFCICKIEGNKQKEAEIGPYFFKKKYEVGFET